MVSNVLNKLIYNGITYIKRGSSLDNGNYEYYFYSKEVRNTYNILYEQQYPGTVTLITKAFYDENTDQYLTREWYTWYIVLNDGRRLSHVCINEGDETYIQDIITNNSYNPDTPINDSSIPNTNPLFGGGGGSQTPDNPNDLLNSSNGKTNNNGENLFDNTIGDNNDNDRIGKLPIGASVDSQSVYDPNNILKDSDNPNDENELSTKGTTYPIIRINDHYFLQEEIEWFSMETGYYKDYTEYKYKGYPETGFLPTMRLIVKVQNPDLLKTNHIKQGDRCSVFFTSAHPMVKSMRCDFKITSAVTNEIEQNIHQLYTTYIILGELYIPDLYNEKLHFNFNGTSRDCMIDAAKKLRLSFFFCDPRNTTPDTGTGGDTMVWCCSKNLKDFILTTTSHAWRDPNAFYETFIDPRYGLAFLNINYLLGETGLDGDIDITFFVKAYTNQYRDAETNSNTNKNNNIGLSGKILSNIQNDKDVLSVFHINSWQYINRAQEIQDFIGLNYKMHLENVNEVFQAEGSTSTNLKGVNGYSITYSMCYNPDKWNPEPPIDKPNHFYVLVGPGRNLTYEEGYSGTDELKTEVQGILQTMNVQADGDAEAIATTGTNELTSGNTHKFFEVAYEHNMRNLLQIQKLLVQVELNGANLLLTRGEKVPVLIADIDNAVNYIYKQQTRDYSEKQNKLFREAEQQELSEIRNNLANYIKEIYTPPKEYENSSINEVNDTSDTSTNTKKQALRGIYNNEEFQSQLNNIIYEAESGWYIIDGIEWVYNANLPVNTGTLWRTNLKLTRREWPIPGSKSSDDYGTIQNYVIINNPGSVGTIKLAAEDYKNYGYTEEDISGIAREFYDARGEKLERHENADGQVIYTNEQTGEIYIETSTGLIRQKTETTGTAEPNIDLEEITILGTNNQQTEPNIDLPTIDIIGTGTSNNGGNTTNTEGNGLGQNIYSGISSTLSYVFSDKVNNSEVTLEGLQDYMKTIYRTIERVSDNRIKLVSARRYALDENDDRIEGNAFIQKGGYFKCQSSTGDILYFKSNNSRHLYGEAFDIINANGLGFIELMTNVIMKDPDILKLFYNYGVSAYIEQSIDDTGVVTKHYHVGTDTTKQRQFWASVKAILGGDVIPGTRITFSNYLINNQQLTEISNG